ncbi:hypothetical protein GvMRE_IIg407 [endosymbiont GvMRE of Glomus versiforme]|nr:hypothetical protein GvMRE_IIg407 [endosymbiont GvMRE of Glomus versiforme]
MFVTFVLHLLGISIAFFQTENNELSFSPYFQVLRLFTWWSVHASILAIITLIVLVWEKNKQTTSWISQFIPFLTAIFNLTTFLFCLIHWPFGKLEWTNHTILNTQLISWHFIAPPLIIYCFYSLARIDLLRKKIVKSILCSFIHPSLYFLYAYIVSIFNQPENVGKISLYLKKYPYLVFQWIVESKKWLFLVWIITAFLIISMIFALFFWTKIMYDNSNPPTS